MFDRHPRNPGYRLALSGLVATRGRPFSALSLLLGLIAAPCMGAEDQTTPGASASAATAPPDTNQTTNPTTNEDRRDLVYYPGDTEHVGPLTKKLLGNVWLDQKAIWTSPFHMNRQNAEWWAVFGGLTVGAVLTDRRTTHLFENSKGQ